MSAMVFGHQSFAIEKIHTIIKDKDIAGRFRPRYPLNNKEQ